MPKPDLAKLCAYWQRELRLQDWDIDVRCQRYYDIEERQGRCVVTPDLKYAAILIRDPHDIVEPVKKCSFDTEQILVHELLHVHFDALRVEKSDVELCALEQALIGVGTALVRMKRQSKTK